MIPLPEVTKLDVAFGNIAWLPPMKEIPKEFHRDSNIWCAFVINWFFSGVSQDALDVLTPKPGVEKGRALAAVSSCLRSFEPKHEHKIAGCAYLMSEWFEERKAATEPARAARHGGNALKLHRADCPGWKRKEPCEECKALLAEVLRKLPDVFP